MDIFLPIDPADIPSAQHKGATGRRGRVIIYTKHEIKGFRKYLKEAIITSSNGETLVAPAYCLGIEYVWRTASMKKSEYGQPRTKRPDLDNLTKLLQDAITDSQIAWQDDSAVSTTIQRKRWANVDEEAHVHIIITEDLITPS